MELITKDEMIYHYLTTDWVGEELNFIAGVRFAESKLREVIYKKDEEIESLHQESIVLIEVNAKLIRDNESLSEEIIALKSNLYEK